MKSKSCFSTNLDPYRAGIEIAEALEEIKPEVIFLFPTIHYKGSEELTEAIFEILDSKNVILIGTTGDGFYEKGKVGNAGVSAIAYNSEDKIKWHLEYESKIGAEPYETTKKCISRLNKLCEPSKPSLYFLTTDFRTDTNKINSALRKYSKGPIIGGTAADENNFKECFVYANQKVLTDSIAILALEGNFIFDIFLAHNNLPIGRTGEITEIDGTNIISIDNIPSMDFIEQELGVTLDAVNEGIITFKVFNNENEYQVRSILLPQDRENDRSVNLFGGNEIGDKVQLCLAPPDKIIEKIRLLGKPLNSLSFKPTSALIISCAGRKKILLEDIKDEVSEIVDSCSSIESLAGFPSFGEFSPVKNQNVFSNSLFHNMTYILLLFGEKNQ